MKINPFGPLFSYYKGRIIKNAVENIDLDNPMNSKIDPEWVPLLQKIHQKNLVKHELETMRREFSANVSHELKTPLTSISGYAELLASGMVKEERVEEFAQKIHLESRRLLRLIEDIIRISKLDERGLEMAKEEVDLFTLARDICSRLSYQMEEKEIQLKLTGKSVQVYGVKAVLDEMLYNICENGIKYNVQGGDLEIWVGSSLEGPKLMVTDTGIGISEEEQARVFERFYRVDKSHGKEKSSDSGGTGLGLSILKNGARIHKASLELYSKEDVGTKVTLTFPK